MSHADALAALPGACDWLAASGFAVASSAALSGDVSPRRYFRLDLADGQTALLAHYPEEIRPVLRRFLASGALLAGAGIAVPAIWAVDEDLGLVLQEDLGPRTLAEIARGSWGDLAPYYRSGFELLSRLAALPRERVEALGSPPLDAERLALELDQTIARLFEPRGFFASAGETSELRAHFAQLCRRAADAPLVPCHRDFMARNLMPVEPGAGLAVLDHQDLRLGPVGYDLASLLNDSLFPPRQLGERWLAQAGLDLAGIDGYAAAAAQRTLKAAGTYAAFAARGATRHLPLLRPTLDSALAHLGACPEGRELLARFGARLRAFVLRPFC